jgi:hypothetical protein
LSLDFEDVERKEDDFSDTGQTGKSIPEEDKERKKSASL